MDSDLGWVISLEQPAAGREQLVGGKAAKLAQLQGTGYQVPRGFCITTPAYERFLKEGNLANVIRLEMGRKPFASLRWEEIWDMALRIRSAFLAAAIPESVSRAISAEVQALGANKALAVRSSAPGEDSADRSFAGLHESVVDVVGPKAVLDAVRVVWASLWSDAALLYRQELSLDPAQSRMAVIVQEMSEERPSGVAFGRDPRDFQKDYAIVERRGGMLIHGSIIARELGIPCVNGIPNAVDLLEDGQLVTVDGFLGIVTVGPPEFDLEVSL